MSNTRHAHPPADGQAQTLAALSAMQRFLILAFAEDTDGLGALGDEYAKHNPVVLASVVCLLAEEVARLTEKSARVLALAVSNRGLAGA